MTRQSRWTPTPEQGMYVVIRIKPHPDDPTRWDGRTKTILGQKPTQHDAITFACRMAKLFDADPRARYFVRKIGQERSITETTPWPRG
jgi:hypothetical protein